MPMHCIGQLVVAECATQLFQHIRMIFFTQFRGKLAKEDKSDERVEKAGIQLKKEGMDFSLLTLKS